MKSINALLNRRQFIKWTGIGFGILTTALSGCQRLVNLFGGDDEPSNDGYDFRPLLKNDDWHAIEIDSVAVGELEELQVEADNNANPLVSDYLVERHQQPVLEQYDNPPKWWLVELLQIRHYQYKYWVGWKTGSRRLVDPQFPINDYRFNPVRQRLVITRAGQVVFDSSRPMVVSQVLPRRGFLQMFRPFRIA